MKLVGRIDVVGQSQDGVFECEEGAGVDVEFDVQIDWAATAIFGVQIDFPGLAK